MKNGRRRIADARLPVSVLDQLWVHELRAARDRPLRDPFIQHCLVLPRQHRQIQPASDLFLGWATGPKGRHVYVRQLRDVKLSPLVETYDAEMLTIYGQLCGWALARAHAKAGDPWAISGYLGKKRPQFDEAMGQFALAYADQAEGDHAALRTAVRAGIVEVQLEH
jgi:hypothetical protein